ncbi:MAG: hypothetical protein E7592_01070 [Ruminococcaceae bacterium]|nr:hypothetical protein [Oscillospiraceae bacterium]
MNKQIEELLAEDGMYVSTTSGVSMMPMLRDRRDTIVITPARDRLKKYDVALYRRGEDYLLHRVVKVLPDSYIICGDNCVALETGITDAQVIGKLTEVRRGEKKLRLDGLGYGIYCRYIVATFYPRKTFRRVKGAVCSAAKKLFGRKKKG